MPTTPPFKIIGRLIFRPDGVDGEHDLGEVEFELKPEPTRPTTRTRFATGGPVLPTGPTPPSGVSPAPAHAVQLAEPAVDRRHRRDRPWNPTVAEYNGE